LAKRWEQQKGGLDRSPLTKKEQADFDAAKRRGKGDFKPAERRKMKMEQEIRKRKAAERRREEIYEGKEATRRKKKREKKQQSTKGYA